MPQVRREFSNTALCIPGLAVEAGSRNVVVALIMQFVDVCQACRTQLMHSVCSQYLQCVCCNVDYSVQQLTNAALPLAASQQILHNNGHVVQSVIYAMAAAFVDLCKVTVLLLQHCFWPTSLNGAAESTNSTLSYSGNVSLALGYHNMTIEYQQGKGQGAALILQAGSSQYPLQVRIATLLCSTDDCNLYDRCKRYNVVRIIWSKIHSYSRQMYCR